ncbi:MAG TPA: hypothetical protein VGM52_11005 [Herbaspirillum sp.]|jgi:hypothetical protein
MQRIVFKQFLATLLLPIGFLLCDAATAADPAPPPAMLPPKAGASLSQLFTRAVTLRGTLDGVPIQMELHLKQDDNEALEGSYFLVGQNGKVLLAGEFEEDALMMEESVNGKDVSGLWDGVYDGVSLAGNWSSLDGSVLRPFLLKVFPVGQ